MAGGKEEVGGPRDTCRGRCKRSGGDLETPEEVGGIWGHLRRQGWGKKGETWGHLRKWVQRRGGRGDLETHEEVGGTWGHLRRQVLGGMREAALGRTHHAGLVLIQGLQEGGGRLQGPLGVAGDVLLGLFPGRGEAGGRGGGGGQLTQWHRGGGALATLLLLRPQVRDDHGRNAAAAAPTSGELPLGCPAARPATAAPRPALHSPLDGAGLRGALRAWVRGCCGVGRGRAGLGAARPDAGLEEPNALGHLHVLQLAGPRGAGGRRRAQPGRDEQGRGRRGTAAAAAAVGAGAGAALRLAAAIHHHQAVERVVVHGHSPEPGRAGAGPPP